MPLSSELAHAALERLQQAARGRFPGPEMRALRPLLELQARWSALPAADVLVAESMRSREGQHLFLYPFAGRLVHVGLAALLAYRVGARQPASFSIAVNDYGFELLCATPVDWSALLATPAAAQRLLTTDALLEDVLAGLNATELSRRRFREIARVAGLVFQGYPGQARSARQLQASSSLFFDVFQRHDAGNLLLGQAEREVLEQEVELGRLRETLTELTQRRLAFVELRRATPFGFPLMVERLREALSTEALTDRVARLLRELERAAAPR
jgi:ATP-dependent Lhr-like helicase